MVFNFTREIEEYCHSDVDLLRAGMNKFREIFLNLHDSKGNFIGCDPLHHLTIAGVAFETTEIQLFHQTDYLVGVYDQ